MQTLIEMVSMNIENNLKYIQKIVLILILTSKEIYSKCSTQTTTIEEKEYTIENKCNQGLLNDGYGNCMSTKPQPINCPSGAMNDGYGNCIYSDSCANIALGIQGLQCPPSACEMFYGPCSCPNGYLDNTYGCICECEFTTFQPITTTANLIPTVCPPGLYLYEGGICGDDMRCASLAYGIDGMQCSPRLCEQYYGACQCGGGYLNNQYGCICDCPTTLMSTKPQSINCPSGAMNDGYGNCIYSDSCANIALGIQGLQCPPSACEMFYGPCSCPNGYLDNTYGCICECEFTTFQPITTTVI